MAEHRDAVRGDQRKDEGVEEVRQAGMTQKRCRLRILWHHRNQHRRTTLPHSHDSYIIQVQTVGPGDW